MPRYRVGGGRVQSKPRGALGCQRQGHENISGAMRVVVDPHPVQARLLALGDEVRRVQHRHAHGDPDIHLQLQRRSFAPFGQCNGAPQGCQQPPERGTRRAVYAIRVMGEKSLHLSVAITLYERTP